MSSLTTPGPLAAPSGTTTRPTACRAPSVSLFFDTLGQVRACCVNHTFALGHVGRQSLAEIWRGPAAAELRRALAAHDYSRGCDFCRWQVVDGRADSAHARKYDAFPLADDGELWPRNMEFNLANTCNLECPMCDGELSSAIRARRDRLPPLPKVYDERFFADLRGFLPHLERAQFLGGEPFLVREHYRVWDLLIADGLAPACEITTNGTQFHAEVERVLTHLPVSINISLDGITPETVAALRKNASLEQILGNFRRFHALCRERGTGIGFNFSLMRQNVDEFGRFLLFADEWQCPVALCTVVHPTRFSLYTLPAEELAAVVAKLEEEGRRLRPQLTLNGPVWDDALARLRGRWEHGGQAALGFVPAGLSEGFSAQRGVSDEQALEAETRDALATWCGQPADALDLAGDDRIVAVESTGLWGIPAEQCLGREIEPILAFARVRLGPAVQVRRWEGDSQRLDRELLFTTPAGDATEVRMVVVPRYDASGRLAGSRVLAARRSAGSTVDVAMSPGAAP